MISVILAILKIIGTILLYAFLLLLFVLTVVLFVNFHYNIQADKDEGLSVDAKISWLFKIFRGRVTVTDGKSEISLKALWFDLSGNNKGRKTEGSTKASQEDEAELTEENYDEREFFEGSAVEKEAYGKKNSRFFRGTKKRKKPRAKSKNRSIRERIGDIRDKINDILNYPDRKEIQAYTIQLIAEELKAIKPKIFDISGAIGFDDPSVTGQLLGLVSAISALSGLKIMLKGDFEKPALELKIRIKGRVSIWSILFPLIKYIFKKPIWAIIKPKLFRRDGKNGNSVKQQS